MIRQVPGSNLPEDTGNFCDSAHIQPAIPETPTTGACKIKPREVSGCYTAAIYTAISQCYPKLPPGIRVVYRGRAPPSIVQKGV